MPHNARVPTPLPELLASDRAPAPRTLVDIFREVVDFAPQSPAVDSGVEVLTYAELAEAADQVAAELREAGVRVGDKVGVRIKSGTTDLYVAILGILCAGAAYVPVDADDPDERARVVFEESRRRRRDRERPADREPPSPVETVVRTRDQPRRRPPAPDDDAWVIFTSGSTGKPKGVAVTHRNAAAFVDAESRMFLVEEPDRSRRPRDGRPVGRLRRELRGDVARLGVRRLPGPRTAIAGAQRCRRRALAGRQRDHRRLDRADPGRAVAGDAAWTRCGC